VIKDKEIVLDNKRLKDVRDVKIIEGPPVIDPGPLGPRQHRRRSRQGKAGTRPSGRGEQALSFQTCDRPAPAVSSPY
jgi:hypothetical protein